MLLIHPLDFITLGVIVFVILGLLWATYQTWKEVEDEEKQ